MLVLATATAHFFQGLRRMGRACQWTPIEIATSDRQGCVAAGRGQPTPVAYGPARNFFPESAPAKNALSRGAVAARQQGPNSQFCVVNAPPRLSEKSQNFLSVRLRHTGLPPLPAAGFGPGPCGAGGPGMQAPEDPGTLFGAAPVQRPTKEPSRGGPLRGAGGRGKGKGGAASQGWWPAGRAAGAA